MSKTKYLKGECQHCSGHLEFPVDTIGLTATCPHCGKETELQLAIPEFEPTVPRRVIVWTAIAVLVLVGALVVAMLGLRHYQTRIAAERQRTAEDTARKTAEATPPPEDPVARAGFSLSKIQLEKTQGSSLVYAVGTLNNKTDRQRFGVRIELDLFDGERQKVGTAKDYQATIEPHADWKFKAMVVNSKTVSARLSSINEDQK